MYGKRYRSKKTSYRRQGVAKRYRSYRAPRTARASRRQVYSKLRGGKHEQQLARILQSIYNSSRSGPGTANGVTSQVPVHPPQMASNNGSNPDSDDKRPTSSGDSDGLNG